MGARSCSLLPKDERNIAGDFAGNVASIKAERLLIFELNDKQSLILLHSISEQLQNVNMEFLHGASMCESVEI